MIHAKVDLEIAQVYQEAAQIYSADPTTLRLREFQLINTVADKGNTICFIPSNIFDFVKELKTK